MCKFSPKSGLKRIDPCMKEKLRAMNRIIDQELFEVVSCCCGHGKYPMTIVINSKKCNLIFDFWTRIRIPRKKRFYKKDKQGYYFIPEVVNKEKRK